MTNKGIGIFINCSSILTVFIGGLVIIGWYWDIEMLKRVFPTYSAMKPNTAICIILLGTSLYFINKNNHFSLTGSSLSSGAFFIGFLTFLEYIFSANFGIDEWLLKDKESHPSYPPGRMAINSAFAIVMLGIAFPLLHSSLKWVKTAAQYILHVVSAIAFIAIIGYTYSLPTFYQLESHTAIAIHSSLCFVLISVAASLINPSIGLTGIFSGNKTGNIMARKIFPISTFILLAFGLLRIQTQQLEIMTMEYGVAFYTLLFMLVSLAIIAVTANQLNKIDDKRKKAEEDLVELNKKLEVTVEARTKDLSEALKLVQINEDELKLLVEYAPDYAMIMLDAEGRICSWNKGAEKLYGYEMNEIVGKSDDTFFTREEGERQLSIKSIDKAKIQGTSENEGWHIRKDNSRFWASSVYSSLYDEHGNIKSYTKITRNITDKKEAEEISKDRERLIRLFLETIPVGVHIINKEGKPFYANKKAIEILGKGISPDATEEEKHDMAQAFIQGSDRLYPSEQWPIQKALTAEKKIHADDIEIRYHNKITPLEISAQPVIENGKTIYSVATVIDNTDRKFTQNRLISILDSAPDAMIISGRDGKIQMVNAQTEKLFGYKKNEIIGQPVEILVPKNHQKIHPINRENFYKESRTRGMGLGLNLFAVHKNGTEIPVEINLSPFETPEGIISLAAIRDVTERKKSEEHLRQIESIMNQAQNQAKIGSYEKNILTQEFIWSDYMFELFDIPHEVYITEEHIKRAIHPDDYPNVKETHEIAIKQKIAFSVKYRICKKSGQYLNVKESATIKLDKYQQVIGVTGMVQDISEQIRIEQIQIENTQLLRTKEVAERTAKLKEEFMANMSHELRTPLNAVLLNLQLLQLKGPENLTAVQQKNLLTIEKSSMHLLGLINDILDFSKIEVGKIELFPEKILIRKMVNETLEFVKGMASKKNISIKINLDPTLESVYGDEKRIKQMLINLLSNAVKFTPASGEVGLTTLKNHEQNTADFIVWDKGIGIANSDQQRIFQPFMQVDARLNRNYEGTGLGLALTLRLAQLHKGTITVESQLNRGSTFTLKIPT